MPSLHRHGTDQKGVGIFQQVFCNAKRADVYTSALLADAMKPLNVLSKFENHFAIRTVRFQVQLEADGYFSAQKFSSLQPQQAGRVGANSHSISHQTGIITSVFECQKQKECFLKISASLWYAFYKPSSNFENHMTVCTGYPAITLQERAGRG